MNSKPFFTLPNLVTAFRIFAIPFILVFVYLEGRINSFIGAFIFLLAALSDILDGYLARRLKMVTSFGKLVDPLADKLLITCSLILLVGMKRLPAWMAMVIIIRELSVTTLRGLAANEGVVISASRWGKYKTFFQSIGVGFLLLHYTYFGLNGHAIGMFFIWIALFFTVGSGYDYFRRYLKTSSIFS